MAHQVWNRTDSDYMKPNSQTKRIAYIDTTKAICIFLMIVGHWNSNELLSDYIYSFHMPAFFVVTGYLYRPHAWFKTLMAYTIPIMVYSIDYKLSNSNWFGYNLHIFNYISRHH